MQKINSVSRACLYSAFGGVVILVSTLMLSGVANAYDADEYSYDEYYSDGSGDGSGYAFDDFVYTDYSYTGNYVNPADSYFSYSDYYSAGSGDGVGDAIDDACCDSTYTVDATAYTQNTYSYDDYYSAGSGDGVGDAIDDACCDTAYAADTTTYAQDTYSYSDYYNAGSGDGVGDAIDDACCDSPYVATNPEYAAYTGVYDYAEYDYDGGTYQTVTYNPYTYQATTYAPYTYQPVTHTPYVYVPPTATESPACDSFTASDYNVNEDDTVTLSWDTTNATAVSINRGVGTVARDGDVAVEVSDDVTYTLTATNGSRVDTCAVTIVVDQDEETPSQAPHCELTASDRTIEEGDEITLRWDNLRTDEVVIEDNHGRTLVDTDDSNQYDADSDSLKVEPTRTTTYTLTAKNGSREDECTVRVVVDEEDEPSRNKKSETPRCVLTISDTTIARGEKVVLSWKNQRTDDIVIEDAEGDEIVNSRKDKKIDTDTDAITLKPTRSTSYTLTAKNGSKERECTVHVTVGSDVTVTGVRSQDGIPLNQVPYTGFDTSDMLTMVLYGGFGIWGSIMGYAFWMKKKAVLAFAESTIR